MGTRRDMGIPGMDRIIWLVMFAVALVVFNPETATAQPPWTKADSGWIPLWNGQDWDGLIVYNQNQGLVNINQQNKFVIVDSMIHAPDVSPGNSHLFTADQYSWYHVRVDYRFMEDGNAGLIVHGDIAQMSSGNFSTSNNRPRSIEVNMRRIDDDPWTLWSAQNLGPYITTTVRQGTNFYLPAASGGVEWTNNPWDGNDRVIDTELPNPENPIGQWNYGEAIVMGDSMGIFILNGQTRTVGWNFMLRDPNNPNDPSPANRIPCFEGGIALQYEGAEIYYKNWEIRLLDSTRGGMPIIPGCADPAFAEYKPFRTVDDAAMCQTPSHVMQSASDLGIRTIQFKDRIVLEFPQAGKFSVDLFDITGEKIGSFEEKSSDRLSIPWSGYSSGLYILRVSDGSFPLAQELVIAE